MSKKPKVAVQRGSSLIGAALAAMRAKGVPAAAAKDMMHRIEKTDVGSGDEEIIISEYVEWYYTDEKEE